ncbi:amidohydrolase [Leucobacter sp. M11]|uniref:amidohydrolase n=1 Tax=Leucobacter sp. M11 TaxID=2993565 RepID=UPI002D7FA2A6|nr:amidohydrolase [Leucobacter sp. M11]MEB4616420.1 amidohydrolase [Leucobacter sp. M11]
MIVDLLITNARVLTQDAEHPIAERFAVHLGRVVAVDSETEGLRAQHTLDAKGATIVPGFNDAHAHSVWFGHTLLETDLSALRSLEDLEQRIAMAAAELDPDAWVIASGFNHMDTDGQYPTPQQLDRAAGGRPVWIKHTSGHSCLINGVALDLLRVRDLLAPDGSGLLPTGGNIVTVDGEPTGLLEEQAMTIVQDHLLPAPLETIVLALEHATRHYASEGLTSVTDAGIGGGWIGHSPQEFLAYQRASESGLLRTRMQAMLVGDVLGSTEHNSAGVPRAAGLPGGIRSGLGDERLQLGPVKIFLDGSILGTTARLSEEYSHCAGRHGMFQGDATELRQSALDLARAGWALAMHAVGDAAIDLALDILGTLDAEGVLPPLPHRLEHGGVVRPEQLSALAKLNVSIVAQPHFMTLYGDGFHSYIGAERSNWSFRMKSLLDAGLPVAGSSDRPVAPGAPLAVIQSAVERRTRSGAVYGPDERLTAAEALAAYTVGSAAITGWAGRKGQIRAGMLADFVLLGDDPLSVPSSDISSIPVLVTVLGGLATFDPDGRFPAALTMP